MKTVTLTLALLAGTVAASAQQMGSYQGVPVVILPNNNLLAPTDTRVADAYRRAEEEQRENQANARAQMLAQQQREAQQQAQRGYTTTYTTNPYTGQVTAVTKANQW